MRTTKPGETVSSLIVKVEDSKFEQTLQGADDLLGKGLTGEAAKKYALEIAKRAWPVPEKLKIKTELDLKGFGTPDDSTLNLEEFLNHVPLSQKTSYSLESYSSDLKYGTERKTVLYARDNIIIVTSEKFGMTNEEKQALLDDVLRCLEFGKNYDYDGEPISPKKLLSKVKGAYYPLVIDLSNSAVRGENGTTARHAEAGGGTGKFIANFDYIAFSTRTAMVTKTGQIIPPVYGFFHELYHIMDYDIARSDYLDKNRGSAPLYPRGNLFLGGNKEHPMDRDSLEKRAKDFERTFYEAVNPGVKRDLGPVKNFILVNDPIESKPE